VSPLDPRALEQLGSRYPFTAVAVVACLLFLAWRLRFGVTAIRNGRELPAADATWFAPFYLCGIESMWHLFSWNFLESWGGIAANPFLVGTRQATTAALAIVVTLVFCFFAERMAWSAGLRCRLPQATLPAPVFAAFVSLAATWSTLIWTTSGLCFTTLPE
jgi:hypothetical protein